MTAKSMSIVGAIVLLLQLFVGHTVLAAAAPWQEVTFTYIASNQELPKVLSSFSRTFGLELQLSSAVSARHGEIVNGKLTTSNPTEFLNQLSSTYGLQWFYYGGTLYVSRNFETATRSISANGIPLFSFRKALTDLGIIETKFGWGEVPDRGVAMVSGPPAYVDLVVWAVATLPLPQPEQQIRVFRLRHAQVSDRVISYRDQQIVTPGVATILRNLVNPDLPRRNAAGPNNSQLSAVAAPLRNLSSMGPDLDAGGEGVVQGSIQGQAGRGNQATQDAQEKQESTDGLGGNVRLRPVIQADPRLNAIVIRDTPQRLGIFEELIALLDTPSRLVEIEAVIVDVNSSKVSELGIDWGARVGGIAGGFGRPGIEPDNFTGTIVVGKNVNPATVIPDAGNFLMSRIRILEGNGDAKVISRPSVLTLDNLGALIDLSDTIYVQSVGERVANVVPISVGTTLKVTPHIIESGGVASIHLIVDIEDGSIQDDRKFKDLPTIRRSVIGTQAVMGARESLLIGGFNSESNIKQVDAVPILGNLPVLGFFFKKRSTTIKKSERLFLITPKIVSELLPNPAQGG